MLAESFLMVITLRRVSDSLVLGTLALTRLKTNIGKIVEHLGQLTLDHDCVPFFAI